MYIAAAPTASTGTNTTQVATTAFVGSTINALGPTPTAPTGLVVTVTGTSGQLGVSWTRGSGTNTVVYYSTTNNVNTATVWTTTTGASTTITGLTNGTTYYVWVTSVSSGGSQSTATGPSTGVLQNYVFNDTFGGTGNLSAHTANTGQTYGSGAWVVASGVALCAGAA